MRQFSHDLRSPLNTILGFADLLTQPGSRGAVDARGQEYAGFIKASGERLLATFTPLLQLARLEVGDLCLDLQPLGLADRVEAVIQRHPGPRPAIYQDRPGLEVRADETSLTFVLALALLPRSDQDQIGIQILERGPHGVVVVQRGEVDPPLERLDHVLAERLCRAMGGRLAWRRIQGRETCFIILPRAGCTEPPCPLSGQ